MHDREGPPQAPAMRPQSAPAASNLAEEFKPHISEQLRRMVAQEVRRKCVNRSNEATQEGVENDFPNVFVPATAEIKEGMKNVSYQFN